MVTLMTRQARADRAYRKQPKSVEIGPSNGAFLLTTPKHHKPSSSASYFSPFHTVSASLEFFRAAPTAAKGGWVD